MNFDDKKIMVVGLGNPGEKYKNTRHNIGFLFLDSYENLSWQKNGISNALVAKMNMYATMVNFVKPQTFMNNSGQTVASEKKILAIHDHDIVVVYDDLDLPFGKIRISKSRGSGGHNGVKSIESHLHSNDFIRVRIGIAKKDKDGNAIKPKPGIFSSKEKAVSNYVLRSFSKEEERDLEEVFSKVQKIIESICKKGIASAMNEYN
ncbi:MAG: aminoacyl-tRNA hydrolase [Candidatus Paceibacterota bacterium]